MVCIGRYEDRPFVGVEALWSAVVPADPPWNKAAVAVPDKLKVQPELFLVAEKTGWRQCFAPEGATRAEPRVPRRREGRQARGDR